MITDKRGDACKNCARWHVDCPVVCPEKDYEICYVCIHGEGKKCQHSNENPASGTSRTLASGTGREA